MFLLLNKDSLLLFIIFCSFVFKESDAEIDEEVDLLLSWYVKTISFTCIKIQFGGGGECDSGHACDDGGGLVVHVVN